MTDGMTEGLMRAIAIVEAHIRGDAEAGIVLRYGADDGDLAQSAIALAAMALQALLGPEDALGWLAALRDAGMACEGAA